MKTEPRRAAPYHHVAVRQWDAPRPVAALQPAELKHRRQPERHRDDRRTEVVLVFILMQRQLAADRNGSSGKSPAQGAEARLLRGFGRQRHQDGGMAGQRLPLRVAFRIAVTAAVAGPAIAAPAHRHRHHMPAGVVKCRHGTGRLRPAPPPAVPARDRARSRASPPRRGRSLRATAAAARLQKIDCHR